jgi:hypothetical protein
VKIDTNLSICRNFDGSSGDDHGAWDDRCDHFFETIMSIMEKIALDFVNIIITFIIIAVQLFS